MNEKKAIERLIDLAIAEDIGDGDHSSLSCIPAKAKGEVELMLKQDGILAGVAIAELIYHQIDPKIVFAQKIADGKMVKYGDIAFTAKGKVHSLLMAERIVLNVMQRMSGIATQTHKYVEQISGTKSKILDTRKTNPGMRMLDKMAVRLGGGHNHRIGLYDMIMLKDNHVDFAGGVAQAIQKAKEYLKETERKLEIEVEVRNLNEVCEALKESGIKRIMLDNFSVSDTHKAVQCIGGKIETESSGGITLTTIRAYAETGVDYISVGALTHHVQSLDMNLKKTH
jgi:nicotinate-nucleotide pyrophosphorylase (carboxylating)